MQRNGVVRPRGDGALTLGRHPAEVERGRRHVAAACRDHSDDVVRTATLLASELITNALRHGTGDITVLVTPGPRQVRVDVADQCPTTVEPRQARLDDEDGRGLMIVETLSSSWGVENLPQGGGKSVWFTLDIA